MRKFLSLAVTFLLVFAYQTKAQTGFSFNCARDTAINGCGTTCITLKSRIPDIRSSTNSYVVNALSSAPGACYTPYVNPGAPGNPTNLTIDDKYSALINLPFSFPFFGIPYNSLVASTNGYISFDASRAGQDSHYEILNDGGFLDPLVGVPQNLPSTLYDRALIMGPYHDLNPAYTTSPTQRIKYDVLGTAPHRKWVLSFYKLPLYSVACQNMIQNTHQLVIYEGLGMVEVFINDKQICPNWNQGRSMIGMQDYNRSQAIMAPGRKASDAPWGSVGMNESWRFTPAAGPTLYRKVELFDLAGTLVATGDTTSIGNNVFEVSFLNVCPTTTTTYIVRSTYADINNPSNFILGSDTITVSRVSSLTFPTTLTNVACNGANNGTFTVTPGGGTGPFEYSLDGGVTYQPSNVFSGLAGGAYTVTVRDIGSSCVKDTLITITEPSALVATATPANATCSATPNGLITVNASGGVVGTGYTYSLNGTTFQSSNTFNVTDGSYNVTVKDANGCTQVVPVVVSLTNDLLLGIRSDTAVCYGASVILATTGNAASYTWTPAGSLNDSHIANPVATPTQNTTYTVNAVLGQCSTTAQVKVDVNQAVQVDAGQPVSIIAGDQVQLHGTASNATSYLWTPADALSSTTILTPIAKPALTTLYTLTVKNAIGCTASDDVLVTVTAYCPKVRNAFTPNGDGINDKWLVYDSYECLNNVTVHFFNRYGTEVFSSKDYHNDWDGRYKGKSVPDGTYYAVVDFTLINGKVLTIKSDVTILR